MSDTTKPGNGGLDAPSKRRRNNAGANSGSLNGSAEPAGGNAESVGGTQGATAEFATGSVGGFAPIDPIAFAASSDNGDKPRRGRGRPKGSKSTQKEEAVSNISALLKIERLLITGCFFLGNIAGAPELQINEEEAAEISDALKELSKHYPIGMSEKSIAWVNLSFAVGGVFGPKIVKVMKKTGPGKPVVVIPVRGKPNGDSETIIEASPGSSMSPGTIDSAEPSYSVIEPPEEDFLN